MKSVEYCAALRADLTKLEEQLREAENRLHALNPYGQHASLNVIVNGVHFQCFAYDNVYYRHVVAKGMEVMQQEAIKLVQAQVDIARSKVEGKQHALRKALLGYE